MADKTIGEKLKEELFLKKENGLKNISDEKWEKATDFCEGYKSFLAKAKTEREAVKASVEIAEKAGFLPFDVNKKYTAGDKYYVNNRGKAIAFVVVGKASADGKGCAEGYDFDGRPKSGIWYFLNKKSPVMNRGFF